MDTHVLDRLDPHAVLATELAVPQPETTSIEIASRRLGIGRSLGFQLAREGRFPVPIIRAGRRLLVPTAPLERVLRGESAEALVS
jgi:hypothetical protein